jgi:hypothetical protein
MYGQLSGAGALQKARLAWLLQAKTIHAPPAADLSEEERNAWCDAPHWRRKPSRIIHSYYEIGI